MYCRTVISFATLIAYIVPVAKGQRCQTTSQCCHERDVCLTSIKYDYISGDKGRISTCEDIGRDMYVKSDPKLKAAGQPCSDSAQCADRCCRDIRGHRARYQVCGTPEDKFISYTCI